MATPNPLTQLQEADQGSDELVGYVKGLYKQEKDRRRPYALQWYLNVAFTLGHQQLYTTSYGTLAKELGDYEHRRVVSRNAIKPRKDRVIARATQDPPVIEGVPPSSDESDTNAAEVATHLLEHHQYAQRMARKDESCLDWAVICTKGFYKTIWNPRAGERMEIPKTETIEVPIPDDIGLPEIGEGGKQVTVPQEVPVIGEDGQPEFETITQGDIEVIVCSPFEVFPIGEGSTLEDPGIIGVIHVVPRTVQYIKDVYGVNVEPQDELRSTDDIYRELTEKLGTLSGGKDASDIHGGRVHQALVYEYWEKTSDKRPDGRWVVVAGDKLVKDEPHPYDHKQLPFDEIEADTVPGRFWGNSKVEHSIPIQREINFLSGKIEEHCDVSVDGKPIRVEGDGIDDDQWVNAAGEYIKVTSLAHKPDVWTPPRLGREVFEYLEKLYEELDDLWGVHDVSRAKPPSGAKSGVALATLQEQDDTMQGPLFRSYHRAREGVGRKVISLAQQFYTEQRKIKIVGANQQWQLADFNASDIEGITDVRVRQSSSYPHSRVGTQQFIFELLQRAPQLYADPATGQFDTLRLAQDLKLGSTREMYDAIQVDIEQAERENERMQNGQAPNPLSQGDPAKGIPPGIGPNQWDNHSAHYREHSRYMKTGEFEQLPPPAQQVFVQHNTMHGQALAAMARPPAQAQTQQQQGGATS